MEIGTSQVALVVKNPPANTGDVRDAVSIPGFGRSPAGGNGNPLPYSCLENPIDRGAWQATVHAFLIFLSGSVILINARISTRGKNLHNWTIK